MGEGLIHVSGEAWNQIIAWIIVLSAGLTVTVFSLLFLCVGLYNGLRKVFRVDTTSWE